MKRDREKARFRALNIASAVCFLIAILLIILLRLLKIDSISQWYGKYTDSLMKFEQNIENMDNRWLAVLVIELNFVIKAIIPWFPISFLCVISGVMFKWYIAIPINLLGLWILFTVKYYWGKSIGGGNVHKFITRYEKVYDIIKNDKVGRPLILFGARLIPCVPINSISQIYGAIDYEYWKYILISLGGFSYKLFSYTVIGRNVYDPLSTSFILPFIPLFFVSSIGLLVLNGAITVTVTARKRIKLSKAKK